MRVNDLGADGFCRLLVHVPLLIFVTVGIMHLEQLGLVAGERVPAMTAVQEVESAGILGVGIEGRFHFIIRDSEDKRDYIGKLPLCLYVLPESLVVVLDVAYVKIGEYREAFRGM